MSVQRLQLDNGLTLLMEPTAAAPVVALQAWVHAGSADERDQEAGVAHLHEHMLFKGTARRGVGEIARTVEASGGDINAWTSFDQTVYHVVLAKGELALGLDILSDALRHSAFDPEELSREIEVVVEEIYRAEDSPNRRLSRALFELAYQHHPYRRPVLGFEKTVRAMSRDDILDFYKRHYRPDNITLVAVGDFEPAALQKLVQGQFGDWESPAAATPAQRPVEPGVEEARFRLLQEDVPESRVAIAWPIPPIHHPDVAALDALGVVLGHGESSRLYRDLRRRREVVLDAYAFAYTPKDPGLFMVGAGLKPGRLQEGIEALFDTTFRLRAERVTPDELEKAKVVILSEAAYQKETVQGQARKLGYFEVVAGDYTYEQRYTQAVRELTPEDLRRAAQRYLHDKPAWVLQTPHHEDVPAATEAAPRVATAPLAEELTGLAAERFVNARPVPATLPNELGVIRQVLPNGAVLLLKPEEAPVMAVRAVALGGQRYESAEQAGIGSLFASVWGAATQQLPADALARQVTMLGGSVAAFSGRNALGVRAEFIAERAPDGLGLTLDVLLEPTFDAAELQREKEAQIQRLKNRDDNGAAVAFDLFAATLFPTHPYGRRVGGTPESLEPLQLDEVVAHGMSMVAPPRLVVSVVGGFDPEEVMVWLEDRLEGDGDTREPPAPPIDPLPRAQRLRRELSKQQAHLVVGGRGTTLTDPDRFPLEVLTTILSGQSGRLFLDLRDKRSLAYSVSCSALEGIEPGHVLVHMGTSPEKVDEGLSGLYEHLERVRQDRVTAQELNRAKRYLIGTHAIDLQRCGARAMSLALGERFGLGYDNYVRYPERIAEVTADDVLRVARRFWDPAHLIEVVVGPK